MNTAQLKPSHFGADARKLHHRRSVKPSEPFPQIPARNHALQKIAPSYVSRRRRRNRITTRRIRRNGDGWRSFLALARQSRKAVVARSGAATLAQIDQLGARTGRQHTPQIIQLNNRNETQTRSRSTDAKCRHGRLCRSSPDHHSNAQRAIRRAHHRACGLRDRLVMPDRTGCEKNRPQGSVENVPKHSRSLNTLRAIMQLLRKSNFQKPLNLNEAIVAETRSTSLHNECYRTSDHHP